MQSYLHYVWKGEGPSGFYKISTLRFPLWKALASLSDSFQNHTIWKLLLDKWMPNRNSLLSISTGLFIDTTLTIKDVLTNIGIWDIDFLNNHLLPNKVNPLIAIFAPMYSNFPDSIRWNGTNTRHFTIQSAYNL